MADKKKFFTRNNNIIIVNLLASCLLLYCFLHFFFSNLKMFYKDITSYMFFSPIILFAGACFVIFYIVFLVSHLDANTHLADRFALSYKIIFTITFLMLIIRSFLGDFMCVHEIGTQCEIGIEEHLTQAEINELPLCHDTKLNVPVFTILAGLVSGLLTWFTPKIKDNDNTEF